MPQLQEFTHHDDALFVPQYYTSVRMMWINLALHMQRNPCTNDAAFYFLIRKYDVEDDAFQFIEIPGTCTYSHYTPRANRLFQDIVLLYPHLCAQEHYFFDLMKIHQQTVPWSETKLMDNQYKAHQDARDLAQSIRY